MSNEKKTSENNQGHAPLAGVSHSSFTCKGCGHKLPSDFSVKQPEYCYLCDPDVTLAECLQDGKPDTWR